jgi:hypothetical protein
LPLASVVKGAWLAIRTPLEKVPSLYDDLTNLEKTFGTFQNII